MDLIDIGANLTHDSFDSDRDAVIERAQNAGVAQLIVTGADVDASIAANQLAATRPGTLHATAGIHPHQAEQFNADAAATLRTQLQADTCVAVGECGLDYFRNFAPQEAQAHAFAAQLELAVEYQMPVFMHQRDAHEDFLALYDRYADQISRGVVHCFTGTAAQLDDYLARDLYIGITGWICDERRGHHLREFIDRIPANRLMIETDAPYLMPRDLKPKPKTRRNEPVHLAHIAEVIAHCRGETPAALAAHTTATARQFFAIASQEATS